MVERKQVATILNLTPDPCSGLERVCLDTDLHMLNPFPSETSGVAGRGLISLPLNVRSDYVSGQPACCITHLPCAPQGHIGICAEREQLLPFPTVPISENAGDGRLW